ncbi:MAG: DUF4127 family protein [Selenomonadaceae bacterium]|nr:DUF4127 family protein [Selenomonadaceae bacterium]
MKKVLLLFMLTAFIISLSTVAFAAPIGQGKKILYVPIDNRPIILPQTVEVAEKLGYEVVVPPDEIIGTNLSIGDAETLWTWLNENAVGASAAVISTDSMLYGSLVASRQHNLTADQILNRAKKFVEFKQRFPNLPIYAFGTVMRTPRMGSNIGYEPEYYATYGTQIFRYTALRDKLEINGLTRRETKEFAGLEGTIPANDLEDWFGRRKKNYDVLKYFVDLAQDYTFEYFLVGCDDGAEYSQTHLEGRHLEEYAKPLGKARCQVLSGADELGVLMLSRAINRDIGKIPFVAVRYNVGTGRQTVPRYDSESISSSVDSEILAAGGFRVNPVDRANFVVVVNTNYDGKTLEANLPGNFTKPRKGTKPFVKMLMELTDKNYPVGIIDIAYANGADNALMDQLRINDLLFKIRAYSGWNTPSNSSGFLIGEGVLTPWMDDRDVDDLLLTRYLDDWVYQANVRRVVTDMLPKMPGKGSKGAIDEKMARVDDLTSEMATKFVAENIKLPSGYFIRNIRYTHPWNRMYEAGVSFDLVTENEDV